MSTDLGLLLEVFKSLQPIMEMWAHLNRGCQPPLCVIRLVSFYLLDNGRK